LSEPVKQKEYTMNKKNYHADMNCITSNVTTSLSTARCKPEETQWWIPKMIFLSVQVLRSWRKALTIWQIHKIHHILSSQLKNRTTLHALSNLMKYNVLIQKFLMCEMIFADSEVL